ncbi:MAG: acyl-CoA dehydrogenase, putative phosphotransferase, partial [uncultured Frankineae bacterium]
DLVPCRRRSCGRRAVPRHSARRRALDRLLGHADRRRQEQPDLPGGQPGRVGRAAPAAARSRAADRPRHGPRAHRHVGARRHGRARAPDAAPVHRRHGARPAVLRDGAGRGPRVPGGAADRVRRRPGPAPSRRRGPGRRAGRPARRGPGEGRPERVRPAERLPRAPGPTLGHAVGRHPDRGARGARRAGGGPGRRGAGHPAAHRRARRLPPGQHDPRPDDTGAHRRRPRLGDVDTRRPAGRPRRAARLLVAGRRLRRALAGAGRARRHGARGLPHPSGGRPALRRADRSRPDPPAVVRRLRSVQARRRVRRHRGAGAGRGDGRCRLRRHRGADRPAGGHRPLDAGRPHGL